MNRLRLWLASRNGRLVEHDTALAIAAGVTSWEAAGHSYTWGAATAAGAVAFKVLLRLVAPVPASHQLHVHPDRFAALPPSQGKLLGRRGLSTHLVSFRLARYLTTKAKYPSSIRWGSKITAWGMLLNDRLGNCTIAGALHAVMCWASNTGRIFSPTDNDALHLYEVVDGYQPGNPASDRGGVLANVLTYWKRFGMDGHKVTAYVQVDPTNRAEVKTAIALFGCLYVGVALPTAAQSQGVHWKKTSGTAAQAGSWGGHCIILTGYDSTGVDTVTWGEQGTATWGWLDAYMDEAYAVISPDWMTAAGVDPQGLNLAALEADLAAL